MFVCNSATWTWTFQSLPLFPLSSYLVLCRPMSSNVVLCRRHVETQHGTYIEGDSLKPNVRVISVTTSEKMKIKRIYGVKFSFFTLVKKFLREISENLKRNS